LGQLINFEGEATDPQDGPDTSLAWSTQGEPIGSGPRLSITDLPVGMNLVTLTATNSLGLTATTTVSIIVKEGLDQPGPTLTAGPTQIGWHVGAGESQLQTVELDIGNSGSDNLEFTASSNAPWLTLSAEIGTAPATLTLTADPAGFAGGVTEQTVVTLTAVGIPGQVITVPVTLSVGNTFVVGGDTDQCPDDPNEIRPGMCGCGVPETDNDADGVGVCDAADDNCPGVANPGQEDWNTNGTGDACEDSDGDALTDGDEVNKYGSDPNDRDTDGDQYADGTEVAGRSDPTNPLSIPSPAGPVTVTTETGGTQIPVTDDLEPVF
jgi:hypothetical protein